MNREIMFRGKRIEGKVWVYGFLTISALNKFHKINFQMEDFTWVDCKVIPETVSQFTGLHDKNGKEAYFDDIVRFPFSLPPFDGTNVKWHTGVIGMDEYGHSCIMVGDEKFHIQGVLKGEVIGSIHDLKTE